MRQEGRKEEEWKSDFPQGEPRSSLILDLVQWMIHAVSSRTGITGIPIRITRDSRIHPSTPDRTERLVGLADNLGRSAVLFAEDVR